MAVYIEGAISAQINLRNFFQDHNMSQESKVHNYVSLTYAFLLGSFLLLFPIVSIIFLTQNKEEINEEFLNRTKYIGAYRTDKSFAEMDERFIYFRKFSEIY